MAEEQNPRRWWFTLPGILTAMVTLISAVTGLIVALREAGLLDKKSGPQLTITATVHPDEECIPGLTLESEQCPLSMLA